MNVEPYLPTPKMARVLWGGLATLTVLLGLDFVGVDIRNEVQAVAPLIVAALWGWAKTDASSPKDRP